MFYYPALIIKTDNFFSNYDQLLKSQYFEKGRLEELQLAKLKKILFHAKNSIPIYTEMYKNIDLSSIKKISDISKLPFISKDLLKRNPKSFEYNKKELWKTKKTTGGSTGQPVTIVKNRAAFASELAATWRGYDWAGIHIGDSQARFWGVPFSDKDKLKAKLTDLVCNRLRLSAFSFTEDMLGSYVKKVNKFKPVYFYGYVSMLNEFGDYFIKNKLSVPFDLRAIITTSEVLHDSIKKKIEQVFKTKVYNEYGCGEIGSIAHECEYGNMHISSENMIVEIVSDNRNAMPGETGEVVVTELNNIAMPLLRYRLGDFGQLSDTTCRCGRSLPILNNIKGRAYDIIRLKNGKMFHGEFFMYIFEDAKRNDIGVDQFQVVQESDYKLLIKIVAGKSDKLKVEEFVSKKIREAMGAEMEIEFKTVGEIHREKSGKMRLIRSKESNLLQST